MRSGFEASPRRIVQGVKSSIGAGWIWAWALLAAFLGLCGLAAVEPEATEAVHSTIGVGGIGCVLWGIWQLMQYDS
jgi:hypothetical protein